MKRLDLMRHLLGRGCAIMREGRRHTVIYNPAANRTSTVPRHREIDDYLARRICRDLAVTEP